MHEHFFFLIRGGSLYDRLVMNAIRSTTVRRRLVLVSIIVCLCADFVYFFLQNHCDYVL